MLDEFLEKMKTEITDGINDMKDISPCGKVVSKTHYERLCSMLADHGGDVVHGNANAHKDKYLRPTIIVNPKDDAKCMTEEIFGPILPVKTYSEYQEVIDYLNDHESPLVTYYFGDKNGENA